MPKVKSHSSAAGVNNGEIRRKLKKMKRTNATSSKHWNLSSRLRSQARQSFLLTDGETLYAGQESHNGDHMDSDGTMVQANPPSRMYEQHTLSEVRALLQQPTAVGGVATPVAGGGQHTPEVCASRDTGRRADTNIETIHLESSPSKNASPKPRVLTRVSSTISRIFRKPKSSIIRRWVRKGMSPISHSVTNRRTHSGGTPSEEEGDSPVPEKGPSIPNEDIQRSLLQPLAPNSVSDAPVDFGSMPFEERGLLPAPEKDPFDTIPCQKNQWNLPSPRPQMPNLPFDVLTPSRSTETSLLLVPEKSPSVPYRESQRSSVDPEGSVEAQPTRESEKIEQLQYELRELQKRFEAQSRDLEISNSFLNTADKSSDLDIIRALQRLNAELQQSTTYMAECLVEDFTFRNITGSGLVATAERFSKRIGRALVDTLAVGVPHEISMLLQLAFQTYLTSELCQMISSWALGSRNNKFIADVYKRLCGSEPQAISGRWRVLTRGQVVQNYVTHPESPVKHIIKDLSGILLITGCTAPESDIISKITSRFKDKLVLLVELAGRLDKMFDDVVSGDFAVFIGRPGQKFEDDTMEDTDGGQVVVKGGPVLCATHLGLIKRVPAGTLWEQGQRQIMTVLKTKVLLESFLDTED